MNSQSWIIAIVVSAVITAAIWVVYQECLIDVPSKHMAVLTHRVGRDLEGGTVIAPSPEFKGVQLEVLTEGRYFYNPYDWDWEVVPQIEIPQGKLGVKIRLYGDDLPAGELIAQHDSQKGIVPDILNPGRYYLNGYIAGAPKRPRANAAYIVELHDPVTIPAGYKGLVTNLCGRMPKKENSLLSENSERGVLADTLDPGTYYLNPYVQEVRLIDCRSQRYNLTDIGFPTRDGFWVNLEVIMEFRVKPEEAASAYILYNEEREKKSLAEEVIAKVILPNARAYTRLRGSNHSGREFIAGDTRVAFQEDFQKEMKSTCDEQGIEVIQALITNIKPPEKIADPVRRRQIALQQDSQYKKEIEQQLAEQELAVQQALVQQKKALVAASQEVAVMTTEAKKKQEVATIDANKRLAVAQQRLLAAKDQAAAVKAKGKAEADVVHFANQAEAAGWQKAIAAFGGSGNEFARWTLLKKLAPAYRSLMINTENSPLMDIFKTFDTGQPPPREEPPPRAAKTASAASAAAKRGKEE